MGLPKDAILSPTQRPDGARLYKLLISYQHPAPDRTCLTPRDHMATETTELNV